MENNKIHGSLDLALKIAAKTITFDFVKVVPLTGPIVNIDFKTIAAGKYIVHSEDANEAINAISSTINNSVMDNIVKLGMQNYEEIISDPKINDFFKNMINYLSFYLSLINEHVNASSYYLIMSKNLVQNLEQVGSFDKSIKNDDHCIGTINNIRLNDSVIINLPIYTDSYIDNDLIILGSKAGRNDTNTVLFAPYKIIEYDDSHKSYISEYIVTTIGQHPYRRYLTINLNKAEK